MTTIGSGREGYGVRAGRDGPGAGSARAPVRLTVVSFGAGDAERICEALAGSDGASFAPEACDVASLGPLLGSGPRDAIVAVDRPPGSDALEVLGILERSGDDVPCLVATVAGSDARDVELLRAGARDCIPIDHLARLGPALDREIRSARDRELLRRHDREAHGGEGKIEGTGARLRDAQALRANVDRLGLAMEAARAGWWEWDLESNENVWSDELWRLYGLDPGRTKPTYEAWRSSIHPDDVAATEEAVGNAARSGSALFAEWRVKTGEGPERWLMSRGRPRKGPDGRATHFVGVVIDVTERKAAEEAVAKSRSKLSAALSAMTDAVFISDLDGRFVEFNDAFVTFHRFHDRAECGRHLDDYPAILDVFLENGEPAPLSRWAVPRALRGETATNAEYSLRRKDTGESWIGSYNFSPIRDENGTIVGSVVVGSDITERKRNELEVRKLNEALEARVRERTEELESFSYSVSHDLRAPLRAIGGFARLLEEEHSGSLDADARRLLGVIVRNSRQMSQLIDDLLAFSRVGRAEMVRTVVEMTSLARAAWADVATDGSSAAELELGDLPPAEGDPGLLRQVWVNILSNAVKFSARSERPRVRVSGRLEVGSAAYEVADNGVGFEPAFGHKLFQVFQRLHDPQAYPGTGIGLALVQRIVRRHGGTVRAEGAPGKGATFAFTIPSPGDGG